MTYEQLLEKALEMDQEAANKDNVTKTDYAIVEFLLDNCEITVPEESEFFVKTNVGKDNTRGQRVMKVERYKPLRPAFFTDPWRDGIKNYAF